MEITTTTSTTCAVLKEILFKHEGEYYYAHLYWDRHDGYVLDWTDETGYFIPEPEWVETWEKENSEYSLAFTLDELSDIKELSLKTEVNA
jgi:hypothetical protein